MNVSVPSTEASVSVRLVWPFLRISASDAPGAETFARERLGLAELGDPETRLSHRAMLELIAHLVRASGDCGIGLEAGRRLEADDLGVLDHVVRACPTLRDGMDCASQFISILHGGAELSIEEDADSVTWRWEIIDGVAQPPQMNDFVTSAFLRLWRRYVGEAFRPLAVHLMHDAVETGCDYAQWFGCEVRCCMPANALVFPRALLDAPMIHANPGLRDAFERHARVLLARIRNDSVSNLVRRLLLVELRDGDPSMETVARKLAMSVATLRRKLDKEGTTHRQILDEVRCRLSKRYLLERSLGISDVAFMLGFAHVPGFYKAFKRWMDGETPAEYRARKEREGLRAEVGRAAAL